jgi:hypothetical protein
MNRLGGKRLRPIERQQVGILKEQQRFQGLAALELSKNALEQRAYRCGGDRIESLAPLRVARHAVHRVDRPPVPFDPVLVASQQRRRCEGKQGQCRHERIRSRNIRIAQAIIWDGSKTTAHRAQQGISGEMLAFSRCNKRHGHPHQEDRQSFR